MRDWNRNYGLNTIVFRHSSIYGGRQFSTFDQGWIGWFCLQALKQKQLAEKGEPIECFTIAGNGKQVRDVLHAEDLINLYSSAFEKGSSLGGSIFNIGGGMLNSLSLLELFNNLEKELDIPLKFEKLPSRHSDQKIFVADIEAVKQKLRWSPKISYRDGIQRQLKWVAESTSQI